MLHPLSFVNPLFWNSTPLTNKFKIFLKHTSTNENSVNNLSIWTDYYIFGLVWLFSKMLAVPHAHQVNILQYPQNEIFIY
ncbi:hypothetical protein ETJ91_25060 [Bacillus albus]|nr:hypothetical protein ETJ91_25060 [Bacillus albus]RXJ23196.1 hypothetical protein ETJ90_25665 [Bacillus albus]RXJ26903.1 hypothetical protein ETJ76_22050 [Bacillus albus]RXJ36847.1 hypothetical protein ETJ89_24165 [Bacillus albus]RXJ54310.1 hypothetical protein ETJ66_20840 [Bacillus albus]